MPGGDSLYTIVASFQGKRLTAVDTIQALFIAANQADCVIPGNESLEVFKKKAFFYYISDDINKATAALLDEMVATLTQFNCVKLEIMGHTCNIGRTDEVNYELSVRRAEAVKKYLMNKGVAEDRLVISGFGSTRPLLSNKSEYGRIKNRRVEFKVVAKGNETE
ncbi:MAG: OmpA family protein [Bacteroidia bacterium]|nr:OmpA family protein [Bacteroidia bacterium]